MKKCIIMIMVFFLLLIAGCGMVEADDARQAEPVTEDAVQEAEIADPEPEQVPQPAPEEEETEEIIKEEEAIIQEQQVPEDQEQTEEQTVPAAAPAIELQIIEGPSYSQGGQICYYRVYAKTSGEPQPEIQFSTDDSKGAWGSDVAQVNLAPGQSYQLEAVAENEAGKAEASIVLEWVDQEGAVEQTVDYTDSSKFKIDVSLEEQMVRVYYQDGLLREMICSGGAPESPTPVGTFKTTQKIHYSWLPRFDVGAYYFVRFYGAYLFHSLPFDEHGNLIEEEAEKLGQPASHGCIRLKVEDARWLYEKLPLGVEVHIY